MDCSVVCGGGVRINYREKIVEEAFNGTCEGETYMEEACNLQACTGNNQIPVYQKTKPLYFEKNQEIRTNIILILPKAFPRVGNLIRIQALSNMQSLFAMKRHLQLPYTGLISAEI